MDKLLKFLQGLLAKANPNPNITPPTENGIDIQSAITTIINTAQQMLRHMAEQKKQLPMYAIILQRKQLLL